MWTWTVQFLPLAALTLLAFLVSLHSLEQLRTEVDSAVAQVRRPIRSKVCRHGVHIVDGEYIKISLIYIIIGIKQNFIEDKENFFLIFYQCSWICGLSKKWLDKCQGWWSALWEQNYHAFFPTSRKGKLLGLTTSPLTCFGSAQRELQKVSLLFLTKVSLLQHFRLNGKWHSWFQYSRRAISATPATIDLFHYCRCSVRS